ncbi:MAG: amidohydrolase family protein [Bacteroidia bacterium]|nr:amidohydrolase family protein [Bacteroidia bacterium]
MKKLLTFFSLLFCGISFGQGISDSRQREIVIQAVNVVPMDSERIVNDQTVIVKDGKIVAIGKILAFGKNALVIDGRGKYLIPGLGEMHAHVPPVDDLEPMKEVLFLFAANGITTIRGMLGHPRHIELRSKINSGEILGPLFFTTGPSFSGLSVKTAAYGIDMVRKQKETGYDFLKLHPGLTKETFGAISSTANEVGIPFVGHVSFGVGVWRAIDAGYSSIDHLDGFIEGLVPNIETMTEQQAGLFAMFVADRVDETRIPKLMQGLKEKNIWVVPTQSLADRWFAPNFTEDSFRNDPDSKYMKIETVNQWVESKKNLVANEKYDVVKMENFIKLRRKLIFECQKNGVGLLLGCDAPQVFNVPGFSTHNELQYLVASGLTPYEALLTGTVNVAKYLNLSDAGVIKPGAVADLILIGGNPLTDISQTKKIEGVMLRGQWMSKTFIESGLKRLEK